MILSQKNSNIELHAFCIVDKDSIANEYLNWLNDLEVVKPIASPILLEPKGFDFIDDSYMRFTAENCRGFFINDLSDNKFIGTAKIDKIDFYNKSAEIGIMIGDKTKWGKGIATRAYQILMKYAFCEMKLHRLWGGTNSHNIAMKKTFLKLGFKEEGILRKASLIDGEYSDNYLYGILDNEYFSK